MANHKKWPPGTLTPLGVGLDRAPPTPYTPSLHGRPPQEHTLMPERILVTEGLEYLGSILCEHLLHAGFEVTALDNLLYGAGQQGLFHLCANPPFDFVKGDVRDEAAMRQALKSADVVVHLAAIVG